MLLIQIDKLPYPCELSQLVSDWCIVIDCEVSHLLPLRNVMTGVFDHKPNVVILGKLDAGCEVLCLGCIDSVDRVIAQITLGIVPVTQRGVDCGTCFNGRVAVASWELGQPRVGGPVGADVLTALVAVARTMIAWLRNGLVADEFSIDGGIQSTPC
jgi:hypothetical protein